MRGCHRVTCDETKGEGGKAWMKIPSLSKVLSENGAFDARVEVSNRSLRCPWRKYSLYMSDKSFGNLVNSTLTRN